MAKYPFEVDPQELERGLESYVDAVFSCLESEFLVMPKGEGFVEYPVFEKGYEALKQATNCFSDMSAEVVLATVKKVPVAMIVLRTVLGFSPPEWAYVATQRTKTEVTQGFIRDLDRKVRKAPLVPLGNRGVAPERIQALVETACAFIAEGMPRVDEDKLHRLDKADTRGGLDSLRALASMGAPYAMMLYERFLGRPFAGHRDSVSELIGDTLESAIEDILAKSGISSRKTKRAEKVSGFEQAPDFIVPDEFNPHVVIEAKITEDDGTARDKVTRILHLVEMSKRDQPKGKPKYEVIACIAGRGFGQRREDMRRLLLGTRGMVFTFKTLSRLVECTRLKGFVTKGRKA